MYKRELASILKRFSEIYPVIGITGPRQSGKTTLAKAHFSHLPYVSLENLDIRTRALQDPRSFLAQYPDGAIFDEVQNVPDLPSYLQGIVDEDSTPGRFVITGSQNFALTQQISQSLSGRIGMTTLLPLSMHEHSDNSRPELHIFEGGYPGLHVRGMHPVEFYPSYIQTYLERDVRQIQNVEDLGLLQTFLKLCAGRTGRLLNFSSLAVDCGISHTTARNWLNILQASYIVFLVQPFHRNFNKRLVKMPKLYFYDTGLVCNLLGIEKAEQIRTHYAKGELYENVAILEVLKGRLNKGLPPNLYFWRDRTGHEVDLIAEWGGTTHALEIKSTATFRPDLISNINYFKSFAPESKGYLVYNGEQQGTFKDTTLVPLNKLHSVLF